MPYKSKSDLPENVQPAHAQEIYMEAYNSAWEQHDQPEARRGDSLREETAHRVGWSAVKNKYKKDERPENGRRRK